MSMHRLILLVAGAVALALPMAAAATPPTPVTITVVADFSGPVPQGTFTASLPLGVGSYAYRVCAPAASVCSNQVTVSF
jgi:hypothetical protein